MAGVPAAGGAAVNTLMADLEDFLTEGGLTPNGCRLIRRAGMIALPLIAFLSSCAAQTVEQRRTHELMTPCLKYIDHYFIEPDGRFLGVVSGRALYGKDGPTPGVSDLRRETAMNCMREQGVNPVTGRPVPK